MQRARLAVKENLLEVDIMHIVSNQITRFASTKIVVHLNGLPKAHFLTKKPSTDGGYRYVWDGRHQVIKGSRVQERHSGEIGLKRLIVYAQEASLPFLRIQHELQRLSLVRTQWDR